MENHKTPPVPTSVRSLVKALKKLNVHSGDCLLIRASSPIAKKEFIDDLLVKLEVLGYERLVAIVVDDFDELSVANETEMNKHGWFRIDALRKLLPSRYNAPEPERDESAKDAQHGR